MPTCPECAEDVSAQAAVCPWCKCDLARARRPRQPKQDLGDDPAVRMLLPVGRSIWAIAAGYLGLISVCGLPAPLALICGIVAIRDIKTHPDRHGMGRAIFGIVMGALGTLGMAIGILAAIMGH